MAKCRVCDREAWVKIPWANTWFCREHFIEYFERKVWRTFSKYVSRNHEKILFTVSGGKDSLALLYSLAPRLVREGYSVSVLFIDLGIRGYSEHARGIVKEHVESLGLELIVFDLKKEYGFTIDDLAFAVYNHLFNRPVCSLCGVIKRYIYNLVAYKRDYDLIVTGHNLNDTYGFIMSALTTGQVSELIKFKPYISGGEGFIAKAKPLFFNYEYENRLYTIAKDVKVILHPCPHAPREEHGLVSSYKKQLRILEKNHPGIGLMFVKNILRNVIEPLSKVVQEKRERKLVKCSICGMPASTDPCSFCRIKIKIDKIKTKSYTS
ncbi:MAG: hypothetical protein B6U89_04720 [Desulfurococcales archaeon ex4484_58]|nr:MAG: hypothetical protein B6U89_04720 [Desulfurococcales archaeon ex4484_58]